VKTSIENKRIKDEKSINLNQKANQLEFIDYKKEIEINGHKVSLRGSSPPLSHL